MPNLYEAVANKRSVRIIQTLRGELRNTVVQNGVNAIARNNGTLLLPGAATPVLGAELFTGYASLIPVTANGTVANGGTSSTATCTAAGVFGIKTNYSLVASGKTYLHTVSWSGNTNGRNLGMDIGSVSLTLGSAATGSMSFVTTPGTGGTMAHYAINGQIGDSLTFSNVTAKEITGYTHGNPALRNFLDSAGTDVLDSVTQVDQPVGLCLDSMGALGTNGALSTGTTVGWGQNNVTLASDGYVLTVTASSTSSPNAFHPSYPATVGKSYAVSVWAKNGTATNAALMVGNNGSFVNYGSTTGTADFTLISCVVVAGATTIQPMLLLTASGAGQTGFYRDLQVREITGNHATQATTANKGILRRTSGRYRWEFDATDSLVVTLPAGFNAATTIDARSTGHVTLRNQNIVGAYSIGPSITSFGRIILPSSPSASDLALLQRYANWLAGL